MIDSKALVIECNKLKAYEEKTWVKNRLDFMNVTDIKDYTERLTNVFAGNNLAGIIIIAVPTTYQFESKSPGQSNSQDEAISGINYEYCPDISRQCLA